MLHFYRHKHKLRSMFNYFSMNLRPCASEFILTMGLPQWIAFCLESGVTDESKHGSRQADLNNMFMAVNFEERGSAEAEENDDNAMMR